MHGCPKGLRILVVDDDPLVRDLLSERLRTWGHQTHVAADVPAALRIADTWEPDVVLTDLVFPGASGVDLLRSLKAEDPLRPVVLVSAHREPEHGARASRAGADDFLLKPVPPDELRSLMETLHRRLHELSHAHRGLLSRDAGDA